MRKRIVYAATHAWSSPIRVGSHHIAAHLGKSADVLYTSHPISVPSLLSNAANQRSLRLQLWRKGLNSDFTPKGVVEASWLMPFAPGPAPIFNSHLLVAAGYKICWPNPKSLFQDHGYWQPHQLWLDSLFQNYWPDLLQPTQLVVRIADHPAHITTMSKALRSAFEQTIERADFIFTPSALTADHIAKFSSKNVQVVPNGVDVAHFSESTEAPDEFRNSIRRKIIFVGALALWIDLELIFQTAQHCPDLDFYLIGPNHGKKITQLPDNVYYLGSRPYETIPAYLQHADAAIAPFNVNAMPAFIESIDAIKLYEYIAAGLPVVATRWSQSLRLAPYVETADQSADAFATTLTQILKEPEHHKAPKDYLKSLDWQQRLIDIESLFN